MSRLEWNAFRNSGTRAWPPHLHVTICPRTPSRDHVASHTFTLRIVHQRFHITICTFPDAFRCVQLALMFPHGRSLSAIFLYGEDHFQTQAAPDARGNIWERLAASGSLWERLGVSGSEYLGKSRNIWERLGISGSVWKQMGASGSLRKRLERMGTSGNVWERMGPSGRVWARLSASGSSWERLGASGSG